MAVHEYMNTRVSRFERALLIRHIVKEANENRVQFYVVIQDGTALAAMNWRTLKERISALANEFGEAALDMQLADIEGIWAPQAPRTPDEDEVRALSQLRPGEVVAVVEGDRMVGVLANPKRAIGSSDLATLYGPRYAVFADQRTPTVVASRTCPNCRRGIDFYRPKRAGGKIERHCPHCDFLIPVAQP